MELNKYIDDHKDQLIKSVQEIVRIPSVEADPLPGKPFGEQIDNALRNALDLAEKSGFSGKKH
jgi:succinyl-diaminopimelate desuccinylase